MNHWKQYLAAAPGIVVSLLPKFACPICAAASIGVLSSLGLGYLLSTTYLLPLTAVLLLMALAALAFNARTRNGYGPFLLGTVATAGVLLGKFAWESSTVMYGAVGLLLVSSVWNAWPRRTAVAGGAECPACESESPIRRDR